MGGTKEKDESRIYSATVGREEVGAQVIPSRTYSETTYVCTDVQERIEPLARR